MIDIVLTLPQVEMQDVDGDCSLGFLFGQAFIDGLGGRKQDPLQIIEFVSDAVFVAFSFEYLQDLDVFFQQF